MERDRLTPPPHRPLSPTAGPTTRLLHAIRAAQSRVGFTDGQPRSAPHAVTEVYDEFLHDEFMHGRTEITRERFAELVQHSRAAAAWLGNDVDEADA